MQPILEIIDTYLLGDIASIAGLFISIIGFIGAIWSSLRSKRAAENAAHIAEQARTQLQTFYAATNLKSVLERLEAVKQAHRRNDWGPLPDRYGALRSDLVRLKHGFIRLNNEQMRAIQSAVTLLGQLETSLDNHIEAGTQPTEVAE